MFKRYLGGVTACLGFAAVANAQQPAATLSRPRTESVPARFVANQGAAPSMLPGTTGPAPTAAVPGMAPQGAPGMPAQGAPGMPAQGYPVGGSPLLAPQQPGQPAYAPQPGYLNDCATCSTDAACDCLCGPPGKTWVSAEWLYWWTKGQNIPPLITSAPPGTARNVAGTLGGPGTQILAGGNQWNQGPQSGFRLNFGTWFDPCQTVGIGGDFFFLGQSKENAQAGSNGAASIFRPFTNALTGLPDSQLVSFPNTLAGTTNVTSNTSIIGGGPSFIRNLLCDPCGRLDLTLGYRYMNLTDELIIRENLTALPGSTVPAGSRFLIEDRFRTSNNFHGGVIGLNWERRFSHWFLNVRSSIAFGVNHQIIDISGNTTIINPNGAQQTFPGGLLAQPTNIGRYTNNAFAVMPEVGVRLGAQVTERMRAFVGYNFMYMSNVARAGDQIDLRVNPNLIAPSQGLNGPALPAFTRRTTDFWAQGVSLGLEFRF
jgi:hypothetical protein